MSKGEYTWIMLSVWIVVFVNCSLWLIFIFKYVFSTSSSRCQVRVRSVPRSLYILYLNCHNHRKIFGPKKLHITTETKTFTDGTSCRSLIITTLYFICDCHYWRVQNSYSDMTETSTIKMTAFSWFVIIYHLSFFATTAIYNDNRKDQDLTCFPQAFMIWDNWLIKLCVPKSNYT